MKFDDLDAQMRVFETAADLCVLSGLYMVARIDERNFTRLVIWPHSTAVFRNYWGSAGDYFRWLRTPTATR